MSPLRLHSSAPADGPRPNAEVHRARSEDARPATREVTVVPLDVGTIYRQHADDVARWARRLGGPDIDVEDVVHEVFLVVQRRVAEWRGEARITTWLYEIAFRVVRDRRRRWRWRRWSGGTGGRE